jgi:hypothetical protein
MSALPLLLLTPLFLVLALLLKTMTRRAWTPVLSVWLILVAVAYIAGAQALKLSPVREHQIWPQVAAATASFITFVLLWCFALALLRKRAA